MRRPRPHLHQPLTWGLRRGAAPGGRGARRPTPEQQQATEPKGGGAEESPSSPFRRHLWPASGGRGSAAEPSPPALPRASAGPSLQARLPRPPPLLQPGPRGPSRGGGRLRGASLLQPGREGGERGAVSTFRAGGWGAVVSRFQAPPPAADSGSTHQREGGGDRGAGGGGWRLEAGARGAHPRARAARLPRPHPSAPSGPPPLQSQRPPGWPAPSPFSPELRTGAGRAGAAAGVRETPEKGTLLLPACVRSSQPLGRAPAHLPDAAGCGDRGRGARRAPARAGVRSGRALLRSPGPGPLYRASKETDWPPGGNLDARRSARGFMCSPKTIASRRAPAGTWRGSRGRGPPARPVPGRAALAARHPGAEPGRPDGVLARVARPRAKEASRKQRCPVSTPDSRG